MEEASFSVEAAIIMPVIIFTILSLVFYGFFLRDIVLIETVGRSLLIESGKSEADIYGNTSDSILDREYETGVLLAECLWWSELVSFELSEDKGSISYKVGANIFGFKAEAGNVIKAADYFDAAKKLRLWKSITEEAKELIFTGGSTDGG